MALSAARRWSVGKIGSSVGERVLVPGLVPYSATKGAVKMFTQGLSREVGSRGITVNNVQPGPIDTDLNPAAGDWAVPQKAVTALDRYGHVDEVAALVAFVAGPEASYITGANLNRRRRYQCLSLAERGWRALPSAARRSPSPTTGASSATHANSSFQPSDSRLSGCSICSPVRASTRQIRPFGAVSRRQALRMGVAQPRWVAGREPIRFQRCYSWLRNFTSSCFAAGTM